MNDEDDKNVSVFAIETQSEDHVWSISPTDEDGYMQLFPQSYPALLNVYRNANDCASRVRQLYDS